MRLLILSLLISSISCFIHNNHNNLHQLPIKFKSQRISLSSFKLSAKTDIVAKNENGNYAEDIKTTAKWVAAAGVFASGIAYFKGADSAIEFVSGYALEQCLSIDNLFVFLVLFEYFKVPKDFQPKVLNYGILGAILLRALFIGFGGAAIANFHQILLLFAGILLYSSYKILFAGEDGDEDDVIIACL